MLSALGCAADSSSPNDEAGANGGKPGDESEEIPGYLVDPSGVTVSAVEGSSTEFIVTAAAGTVAGDDGDYSGIYATVWGVEAGKLSTSNSFGVTLLNGTGVKDDGSFALELDAAGYGEFIVQARGSNPGVFSLNVRDDGVSNSVLIKPFEASFATEYFRNEASDIFIVNDAGISAEKANRLSIFYTNYYPATSSKSVGAIIEIFNTWDQSINLNGYEIHYFMTDDGLTTQFASTTDTTLEVGQVTYTYNDIGALSYIAFFIVGDVIIEPNGSATIGMVVTNTEDTEFNQLNDPSFVEAQTERGLSQKIHIYDDVNDKLWGD